MRNRCSSRGTWNWAGSGRGSRERTSLSPEYREEGVSALSDLDPVEVAGERRSADGVERESQHVRAGRKRDGGFRHRGERVPAFGVGNVERACLVDAVNERVEISA